MAVDRQGENEAVAQNIYDNNAKEIDPAMVRAALQVIIDSNFNLIEDVLQNLRYDQNRSLSQVMPTVLWGATGVFDVGAPDSEISGNQGIVSSCTSTRLSNQDSELDITFSQNITGRKISANIFTNSINTNENNDITTPTIRVVSGTRIIVGLRQISTDAQQIRLEILAFKIEE